MKSVNVAFVFISALSLMASAAHAQSPTAATDPTAAQVHPIDNQPVRGGFYNTAIPLDQPHIPLSQLRTWAALAASDVLTFGFNNHKERLSSAAGYFTEPGWASFQDALKRERIIEMVEANQQVLTAAAGGAPVLKSREVKGGVYHWVVEVPLVVTYQAGAQMINRENPITLVIVRADAATHPDGLAIQLWTGAVY